MKRWLITAGMAGVLALAATATAGPKRTPNGDFDRVGRWAHNYVRANRTFPRTYIRWAGVNPSTSTTPQAVQKPRKHGDIVDGKPVLTKSTRHRMKAALDYRKKLDRKMYKLLKSDVEQKMKCVDSQQCGSFAPKNLKKPDEEKANLVPNRSKVDRRLEIKYKKMEGMLMPSLTCSDMADCL